MTRKADSEALSNSIILENMKKSDKFIGDILAPFEQILGMKFNKFEKPEDPKYVEPKKKGNLKLKLKQAQKKQEKLKKMSPEKVKEIQWQNALSKAQGVKIKDDPKLIKKAIKRKTDEKRRSKKKWDERVTKLEEAKNIRKKKSDKNKAVRRDQKKNKKKH